MRVLNECKFYIKRIDPGARLLGAQPLKQCSMLLFNKIIIFLRIINYI